MQPAVVVICALRSDTGGLYITECYYSEPCRSLNSNPSCVRAVTGTRILNSIEFRPIIIQTLPTLYLGVNLVRGPQIQVKRDQETGTGRLEQVRQLPRLGERM